MLTLYYGPQTRSTRPRFLLEELGVPYEIHRLDLSKGEHKSEEYLKVHPLGKVPALRDGEQVLFESVAICLYLADRFSEKGLAPALNSPERGLYYQWILFAVATLEPLIGTIFVNVVRQPENKELPATKDAQKTFAQCVTVLEAALAKGPFILGEKFSAADVILGSMLAWAKNLQLLEGQPNILGYVARIAARPAYQNARKD